MSTPELKPCPFCGEQPIVRKGVQVIVCESVDCIGARTTAGNLGDAIVQWNARVGVPAQSVNGKQLEGERYRIRAALYAMLPAWSHTDREIQIRYNLIIHIVEKIVFDDTQAASPPSGAPGVRYAPAEPLERFVHGPDFTLNKVYPVVEHGNGWLRVIALASTEERQAQIIAALSVSPHDGEAVPLNLLRQVIASEWGSAICYREPVYLGRTCDTDKHCRCADIARAIQSDFNVTTRGKQSQEGNADHLPRCDCDHLFEICDYPKCVRAKR